MLLPKEKTVEHNGKPSKEYVHALHCLLAHAYPLTQARWGLDSIRQLLQRLGNPQTGMKIVQVGGTNGKGSVCAFLGAMLKQADVPYGVFTSPHLSCMRERIEICGKSISETLFCQVHTQVQQAAQHVVPAVSLFERLLAMALLAFARQGVQVAVLEVGLGGRLDATTAVMPHACAITSISYDHTHLLGKTLASIAQEKAGIFKPGVPVIACPQSPQVSAVLRCRARAVKTQLFEVGKHIRVSECHDQIQVHWGSQTILPCCRPALFGCHQHSHAAVASALLTAVGVAPQLHVRKRGAEAAQWPGRYEWLRVASSDVLLDGAHNPAALIRLAACLKQDKRLANRSMIAVVGFSHGHDPFHCAEIWQKHMPPMVRIFTVATSTCLKNSMPAAAVAHLFLQRGVPCVQVAGCISSGFAAATNWARKHDGCVLVTGSLYVVGRARALALRVPCDF